MTHLVRLSHPLVLVAVLAACSDDDRVLVIEVTPGHEVDAFQLEPAIARVDVIALDAAGNALAGVQTTPGGSFALGEMPVDQLVRFDVHASDAGGTERMAGSSLAIVVGGLETDLFPVFAQRIGQFSRPPGALRHGHVDGVGGVIGERYLFVTGGEPIGGADQATAGSVAFYDLLALGGAQGGTLARVPRSLVVSADGSAVLVIDEAGADWVDLLSPSLSLKDVPLPPGLDSFAQVAGGRTVIGPDQSFVVGGTRTDEPSDRVLVVNADRSLSAVTTKMRRGAAATWVDEIGLAIAGGSGDPGAPGVEVLVAGTDSVQPRSFDPDPVEGAGAVAGLVGGTLVLLCGSNAGVPAPPRSLDLRCAADCMPAELTFDMGAQLSGCESYRTEEGLILTVGTEAGGGLQRAFSIDPSTDEVIPLPLREPRRGAAVVPAPNGTMFLLGGVHEDGSGAFTVESLLP